LNNTNIADITARASGTLGLTPSPEIEADVIPRQVPYSAGDKNLRKEGGDAPRVVVLICEIDYVDPDVHIYTHG
jgi:hypothetical protein